MKAAAFDYQRPNNLAQAVSELANEDGLNKPMAGSQSLGPMLNMRLARPSTVVDISGLPELQQVQVDGDTIQIGAGVTHSAIEDGVFAALNGHPIQGVAGGIAYRAIRTRGTLGGSLAHADPAADWIVVMRALEATIQISGANGTRSVVMSEFMQGAYTTVLDDNELITRIDIPSVNTTTRWGYYKSCRKPGEFADASAAVLFDPTNRVARVVLGALDGPPRELPELARAIASNGSSAASRAAIGAAVATIVDPADPVQCKLHTVCTERALRAAGLSDTTNDTVKP